MACGTGKTLIALWIAEKIRSHRTLVLVPSLTLIAQNITEWKRNCSEHFDLCVVCSDETVVGKKADAPITSISELSIQSQRILHQSEIF